MHFTCRFFAGRQEGIWSQFWENEPDDPSAYFRKGHLFGLVSTPSSSLGRLLIDLVNQSYFSSTESHILSSLSQSVGHLISDPRLQNLKFSLSLAVASDHRLYLLQHQLGNIILKRQNQVSLLLRGVERETLSLAGQFSHNDWLFFASAEFCQKFSWEQIKTFVGSPTIPALEEKFNSQHFFSLVTFPPAAVVQFRANDVDRSSSASLPPLPSTKSRLTSFFHRKADQKIYVSPRQLMVVGRRRQFYLVLSLILLSVLAGLFFLGYRKNRSLWAENEYRQAKTRLDQKLKDALAVKNLDLDSSQKLAQEAKDILQKLKATKLHPNEVESLNDQITLLLSQTGVADDWRPDLVYDTSLIGNSLRYSRFALSFPNLYLLDQENGRIDSIDLDSKSTKNIITHPDVKSYSAIVEDPPRLYISNDRQISLVGSGQIDPEITLPVSVEIRAVKAWNHAFYVLDSSSASIIKYTPSPNGFEEGKNWLSPGEKIDFFPISMAINGKIWLLSSSGQVVPYLHGTKDRFSSPASTKFADTRLLSISREDNYLAFVDSDSLVYLYRKNGELVARYNLGSLKILDLALSADSSALYILCYDQKIYRITF